MKNLIGLLIIICVLSSRLLAHAKIYASGEWIKLINYYKFAGSNYVESLTEIKAYQFSVNYYNNLGINSLHQNWTDYQQVLRNQRVHTERILNFFK